MLYALRPPAANRVEYMSNADPVEVHETGPSSHDVKG